MLPSKRQRDEPEVGGDARNPKKLFKLNSPQQASNILSSSSVDLNRTMNLRRPTLTPVDSSDDEDTQEGVRLEGFEGNPTLSAHEQRMPTLQGSPGSHAARQLDLLATGNKLSPWPATSRSQENVQPAPFLQAMVKQSLDLSYHTSMQQYPANQQLPDPDAMEDVYYSQNGAFSTTTARLPSPVSDGDLAIGSDYKMLSGEENTAFFSRNPTSTESSSFHLQALRPANQLLPKPPNKSPRKTPTLVMGPRADCDKCRRRVPGHYNHILRA